MVILHFYVQLKMVTQIFVHTYIIDNVDENKKNPADNNGFTPLHYAAMLNDLKIYKVIAENIED